MDLLLYYAEINQIQKGKLYFYFRKVSFDEAEKLAKKENIKYFEISAKTGDGVDRMAYSAISDLSFFDQFDVDRNVIINELEFDNNKKDNLDNSSAINIVKNVSSARNNNINVKDVRGNMKERVSTEQNKKNCGCQKIKKFLIIGYFNNLT